MSNFAQYSRLNFHKIPVRQRRHGNPHEKLYQYSVEAVPFYIEYKYVMLINCMYTSDCTASGVD